MTARTPAKTSAPETTAVAVQDSALPAFLQQDIGEVAGLGNSNDPNDSSLPFLAMIQSNSPQIVEENSKYIPDAKAGFVFNTATREAWPARVSKQEDGVIVIPCGYLKQWVEWKPNRGGYAGSHPFTMETLRTLGARKTKMMVEGKEREQIVLPNGNILTETAYTFLIVNGMPMVLGASSTALGAMRDWMAYRRAQRIGGKELPSFAKQYRLRTVQQTKDNNTWYNWVFKDEGFVTDESVYAAAKGFATAVAKGEVSVGRPDFFDELNDEDESIPV